MKLAYFEQHFLFLSMECLRVSELTSLDRYSFNHAISIQDLKMLGDGLEVCLRTSEMDQFSARVAICISTQPDKRICPVSALVDYLSRHSH